HGMEGHPRPRRSASRRLHPELGGDHLRADWGAGGVELDAWHRNPEAQVRMPRPWHGSTGSPTPPFAKGLLFRYLLLSQMTSGAMLGHHGPMSLAATRARPGRNGAPLLLVHTEHTAEKTGLW